jgi:4-diphosphocytidyl-2-C-methyl-D-erythritol kinase
MALTALHDLPAPAKLNLFLHVVGRRADGYHLIQSPFVLIDWADTIHLMRRDDGVITRRDVGATLPEDDLTIRAARALQQDSGTRYGVDLVVEKSLPWGAGLGGGSSDAATALLGLNRLWGLGWGVERLAAIGLALGADVPFFVRGRNAFVEGIGEVMTPIDVPPQLIAVVKPDVSLPTRDVFTHPNLPRDTSAVILAGFPISEGSGLRTIPPGQGRNDLQAVAESLSPEVAQAAVLLAGRFGNSRMTGSGSAVFAVVGPVDGTSLPAQATSLPELPAGWVGRICRTLDRHPLADWAQES